ncbi:S41 family peptidase [Pelagicoccus sp. SDUM812003]|uniref:S41 family peptidase n=1 Tax=Pelagicoccus sp. SDUM812003 TaxID=3041267 RepID=UPI00280E7A6D|nr:S41 family peptidase [Pelagicoccus sp. SDUM812003]MDQ8201970.1 S41 family peptidase [Pelagicoccus sp. SDUM812003]
MPRASQFGRFALLLCAGFCLVLSLEARPAFEEKTQRLVEAIGKRLQRSAVVFGQDFSDWEQHVAAKASALSSATSDEEIAQTLGEILESYELSHLAIFSPDSAKLLKKGLRSGIGISLHPIEEGKLISYVVPSSPADACGLQKGDVLTQIDGAPIDNVEQLRGEIGQRRELTWIRGGERMSCEIEYAVFESTERSSMYWLNDDIVVIRIASFQYRFYQAHRINRFFREARHAKAVVIDLRNNRGGLSFYSRHLASKVSPCDSTYALLAKRKHLKRSDSLEELARMAKPIRPLPFSRAYRGKIIVLVDSLSSSAADIFPAFIQETGRGTVIGQTTSGSLQLARTFRLPYGFKLYVPISEILTPNGNRLEGRGFSPDISLSLEQIVNDDFVFQRIKELVPSSD